MLFRTIGESPQYLVNIYEADEEEEEAEEKEGREGRAKASLQFMLIPDITPPGFRLNDREVHVQISIRLLGAPNHVDKLTNCSINLGIVFVYKRVACSFYLTRAGRLMIMRVKLLLGQVLTHLPISESQNSEAGTGHSERSSYIGCHWSLKQSYLPVSRSCFSWAFTVVRLMVCLRLCRTDGPWNVVLANSTCGYEDTEDILVVAQNYRNLLARDEFLSRQFTPQLEDGLLISANLGLSSGEHYSLVFIVKEKKNPR